MAGIDMNALGERLIGDLLSGSEGMSTAQLVNKLVDDKLKANGKEYDRDSVLFVDELNARIESNPNADAETIAGWRRMIVKYSS